MMNTSAILQRILIQVAECLQKDTQWELGRIADQVLPLLTEATFFTDLELLEKFWKSVLLVEQNRNIFPLCMLACKSLKVALKKSVNLEEKPLKISHKHWARVSDKEKVQELTQKIDKLIPNLAQQVCLIVSSNNQDIFASSKR